MDSAAIQAVIKGKKLDKKPVYDKPNGKVIDWTLSFQNPSESQGLTFKYLGAGSNKMVAQVYKTSALPWVLCWQSNERYQGAYRDFKDEVETLQRLGKPDGACDSVVNFLSVTERLILGDYRHAARLPCPIAVPCAWRGGE